MKKLIEIFLGSFLLFHFSMVMFYIIWDNPIYAKHEKIIDAYIDPFFSQTWRMFAPNPVNANQTLLFIFISYSNGKADTLSRDATTSLIAEHMNTNVATSRISNFLYHNITGLYKLNNALIDSAEKNEKLNKDSVAKANFFYRKIENSLYFKILYDYSKRCFFAMHNTSQLNSIDSVFVRISIVNKEFPRFKNRYSDYYDEKNYQVSTWNSRWQKLIDK